MKPMCYSWLSLLLSGMVREEAKYIGLAIIFLTGMMISSNDLGVSGYFNAQYSYRCNYVIGGEIVIGK